MSLPDIRLAKVFIQTERGVVICPVIMDFNRRGHFKTHRAGAGRPHFWIQWHPAGEAIRRLRHECAIPIGSILDCMRCRLTAIQLQRETE